jgi:hypothetical protein
MNRLSDFPPRLIEIGDGDYDLGMNRLRFPQNCEVRGQSRRGTRLLSAAKYMDGYPCTFELDYGTILRRLTLASIASMKDQVCLVGFRMMPSETDKPLGGELVDLHCSGKSWCFYFWNVPAGNTCKIINCYGESSNITLACCKSSGATAQFIDVRDSHLVVKPELSDQGGSVTHPVYGGTLIAACRGGRTRIFNSLLEGKGEATAPRLVGITDWYDDGSKHTKIELHNSHIRLTQGNGEKECFDLDIRKNPILVSGGTGSAADGTYSLSPFTVWNKV